MSLAHPYIESTTVLSDICRRANATASDLVLESVRNTLETFNLSFTRSDASIIPGSEEGLAAWISSNYIVNTLARQYVSQFSHYYMFVVILLC